MFGPWLAILRLILYLFPDIFYLLFLSHLSLKWTFFTFYIITELTTQIG